MTSDLNRAFLFTDIEGSTQLWENYPVAMRTALARHDALLHQVAKQENGHVFKTIGDAFCIVFTDVREAVVAAVEAQRLLHAETWGEVGAIRVRMGVHVGTVEARDNDYFGPTLNRVSRLRDAGNGGQLLLSETVVQQVGELPPGVSLSDEGEHELKGLEGDPQRLFQVVIEGVPQDGRKLRTRSVHPHNLPATTTAFVGRQAEARAVRKLLAEPGVRLVTLTGMGGSGKTRLALEAAGDALGRYPGGVWLADLAPLSEPGLVLPTVLRACGLEPDPSRTPIQQLAEHFLETPALLVLDNFEQVEDAADDLAALLRLSRTLQVLVTSRVLLNLSMEHEYAIPPLRADECATLFLTRARQARPDLEVTEEVQASIAAICAQLDGMPLAVELAAAQVRSLSPADIQEALGRRLQVLSTKMRDLPPRHRSLRGAIDWSYDLLTEEEQAVFRGLSVFVGGFTPSAAEVVCGKTMGVQSSIVDLLDELSGKSLLRREGNRESDRVRYLLLESLREYGHEKLEQGETDLLHRLEDGHVAYYLNLSEEQEPLLRGVGQTEASQTLESEIANLRAGIDRALGAGAVETAARYSVALRRFWERGWGREALERMERILAQQSKISDGCLRAELLFVAGCVAWALAANEKAMRYFQNSADLSRALGNAEGAARALTGMGATAYRRGDLDDADRFYEEALALKRELGDRQGEAALLNNQGVQAVARGDYHRAQTLFAQCLAINEELGDGARAVNTWNSIGIVADALGEIEQARDAFTRMLSLIEQSGGDPMNEGRALCNLGGLAIQEKDYPTARRLLEEARTILVPIEDKAAIAECLSGLGLVAAQEGDAESALRLCQEGLFLHQQNEDKKGMASALEMLAEVVAESIPASALQFLRTAEGLRQETGARRTPFEAQRAVRVEAVAVSAGGVSPSASSLAITLEQAQRLAYIQA
jgi:predicted ATPase/class 3 adenylate cyclase/Flp pilus assembly protein TadD